MLRILLLHQRGSECAREGKSGTLAYIATCMSLSCQVVLRWNENINGKTFKHSIFWQKLFFFIQGSSGKKKPRKMKNSADNPFMLMWHQSATLLVVVVVIMTVFVVMMMLVVVEADPRCPLLAMV